MGTKEIIEMALKLKSQERLQVVDKIQQSFDQPDPQTGLCDSCAGIQRNWRGAPGHAELMQGVNRKEPRSHGQVTITKYRCERCGTEWEYENNKVNLHAGWSVVGQ